MTLPSRHRIRNSNPKNATFRLRMVPIILNLCFFETWMPDDDYVSWRDSFHLSNELRQYDLMLSFCLINYHDNDFILFTWKIISNHDALHDIWFEYFLIHFKFSRLLRIVYIINSINQSIILAWSDVWDSIDLQTQYFEVKPCGLESMLCLCHRSMSLSRSSSNIDFLPLGGH